MQTIQSLLREQISNQSAVFVFPTDVACQKWADWAVRNTGARAVAMERFMAWDRFKGERVRADAADLRTVPSLMRRIFADCLIQRNAERPFFRSLIAERYAGESSSFAGWLASILPPLKMWRSLRERGAEIRFSDSGDDIALRRFYESYKARGFTDDEDADFEILYDEYSRFLAENSLFDPAWVEPDFSGDGREYFLIYPGTLEDWEQYRVKLSRAGCVHFVDVPEEEGEYESRFFENSSVEVRDVALFLREMHDERHIAWSDMAVSVPRLDNYGSYLDREFSLYEIPHSMRYSRPLSSYGAGALFGQIQDCVSNQFSYESVKNLLLNEDLPWANRTTIENLLLFGRMNNCICTAGGLRRENGKVVTVWDEAFRSPRSDSGTRLNSDELIKNLYRSLVDLTVPLVEAETFAGIRSAYEKFRETFFDMAEFQSMTLSNNVLSRCVSALNEIVDLEAEFPRYRVASPFAFFVSHLSCVQYLSQGESRAVQVYPYRSASAAPYKIHVVVDSTQDSLSVAESFRPLGFLSENKRRIFMRMGEIDKSLGITDSDPTFDFVRLYQHSATEKAYFTASRHAYNGEYGFAYGKMERTVEKNGRNAGDFRADPYTEERNALLADDVRSARRGGRLPKIYAKQAAGLSLWKKSHGKDTADSGLFEKSEKFTALIQSRLRFMTENSGSHQPLNPLLLRKIEITQTTLRNYFTCPRRWLFKSVLRLAPPDNEAELIDEYILGTVNHKVFERFFARLMDAGKPLCAGDLNPDRLGDENRRLLIDSVNEAVSAESRNSAFKEIFGPSYERTTASRTTIKIISAQYRIDDAARADENASFRMLEKSAAYLCRLFSGCKVHAVEKEIYALPPESGAGEGGYYFAGKIDCILAMPGGSEFVIVDYKTSSVPKNLFVRAQEEGRRESVIDFQMPMYVYLLRNAVEEGERLTVSAAAFYSIKNREEKFFLGSAPNSQKSDKNATPENAALAESEFLRYARRFYEEVTAENFAVSALNQSRTVCTATGEFDNCIDYHALCRRFFTVSGEK